MAAGEELLVLINNEIPDGREKLHKSYMTLEQVAKYCEDEYRKAGPAQKASALETTKNYTTHSLASVAYEINNLATNFLKLLDLQHSQLTDMESSVNHLNQAVMIHKEKVARREIGILTNTKTVPKPLGMKNGVIYPEQTERPIRYTRKPIDYNILDDIGHGVKPQGGSTPRAVRSPSVSSNHSSSSGAVHHGHYNNNGNMQGGMQATKPPTPPVYRPGSVGGVSVGSSASQGGTIGRAGGSQYRAPGQPPPVAPPLAPSAAYAQNNGRGQSYIADSSELPLPPPLDDDLPAPDTGSRGSSPLPPPPGPEPDQFDFMHPPPPEHFSDLDFGQGPPSTRDGRMISSVPEDTYAATQGLTDEYAATGPMLIAQGGSWVPPTYIEKVVAIHNYAANKSDELTFAENAVIYVIHKNDDGWWEGVMDGQTGLFPFNYVESCML